MPDWEDHYEILGVHPDASQAEIKRARNDSAKIYHPDRMQALPPSAQRRAEEALKKVNQAWEILGNPKRREEYHAEWLRKKGGNPSPADTHKVLKAKPVVDPSHIRFSSVPPGTPKTRSFMIRNEGGSYSELGISDPKSWVRIAKRTSLSDFVELPLRVEIEVEGDGWAKTYSETITVSLDDEETEVKIELRTSPRSVICAANDGTGKTMESLSQVRSWLEDVKNNLGDNAGLIVYGVLCIPVALGAGLLMNSVEEFSAVWCLGLLVILACLPGIAVIGFYASLISLTLSVVFLILWIIIALVKYFFENPW